MALHRTIIRVYVSMTSFQREYGGSHLYKFKMHRRIWGVLTEVTQCTVDAIHTGTAVEPKYPHVECWACTIWMDALFARCHFKNKDGFDNLVQLDCK